MECQKCKQEAVRKNLCWKHFLLDSSKEALRVKKIKKKYNRR